MGRLLRVPGYPISVQSIIFPRPDGISHPLAESDHSESITPHIRVSHPPQPHCGRGVTALRRASRGFPHGLF